MAGKSKTLIAIAAILVVLLVVVVLFLPSRHGGVARVTIEPIYVSVDDTEPTNLVVNVISSAGFSQQLVIQSAGIPTEPYFDDGDAPNKTTKTIRQSGASEHPVWPGEMIGEYDVMFGNTIFSGKIICIKLDIVKEVPYGSGVFVAAQNLPVFRPDTGEGRGALVTENLLNEFQFDWPTLNPNEPDTLNAKYHGKALELTETGNATRVFRNATKTFELELVEERSKDDNVAEAYDVKYSCADHHIQDKVLLIVESDKASNNFLAVGCKVQLKFSGPLSPELSDKIQCSLCNPDNMGCTNAQLIENAADSKVFVSDDGSVEVKITHLTGFDPNIADAIAVNVTSAVSGSGNKLYICETGLNTLEFRNSDATTVEGPDPAPEPVPDSAKWRAKVILSDMTKPVIYAHLKSDVEVKEVLLTNHYGEYYLSNEIVLVPVDVSVPGFINLQTDITNDGQPVITVQYNPRAKPAKPVHPAFLGS